MVFPAEGWEAQPSCPSTWHHMGERRLCRMVSKTVSCGVRIPPPVLRYPSLPMEAVSRRVPELAGRLLSRTIAGVGARQLSSVAQLAVAAPC